MCRTIITLLDCGHREVGPLFRCDMAVASRPRGYPYDDGRIVVCQPNEIHNINQKSFCEECVGEMIQRLLTAACQTCRRNIVTRMGEAVLDTLPQGQEAANQQGASSGPDTAEHQGADAESDTATLCHW
ncbi:hypothetical protein M409DRAFT_58318 [Zasmidium cellare ATCC 36951]|uniref:Uncharacterized protein n=1 Tax=Zasmidium cellare ATCC 36951 TaxID=1080233 RepID=A0A6A6C696_ZASCE|nr:uncharacterized protein M409DRAFT_58318 [Zasmidium cellare ATCC 36951]KAF2162581.1 hypothetical protein M409DRAFT_58318 [Zasmidium cellare ATCC 36951]